MERNPLFDAIERRRRKPGGHGDRDGRQHEKPPPTRFPSSPVGVPVSVDGGSASPLLPVTPGSTPLTPMGDELEEGERQVDCPYRSFGAGDNLHRCATGYAALAGVTGGLGKPLYVVNSSADALVGAPPGTLRWGLWSHPDGVTVRFLRSMTIALEERLFLKSHVTIDGRGANVVIRGGMVMANVTNIILHNIEISNQPGDHDVVHITGSTAVWVDHCRVQNATRGTIDAVYGATDITISNCHIRNRNLTMLLGAEDDDVYDVEMRVTLYRNWFERSGQRQPKARWGWVHVANNLYTKWTYYCLGGRMYANIRSERNVFRAGKRRKEVTPWFGADSLVTEGFDTTPVIQSFNDTFLNGATFAEFNGQMAMFDPPYRLPLHLADLDLEHFLKANAGPLYEKVPELPCDTGKCIT